MICFSCCNQYKVDPVSLSGWLTWPQRTSKSDEPLCKSTAVLAAPMLLCFCSISPLGSLRSTPAPDHLSQGITLQTPTPQPPYPPAPPHTTTTTTHLHHYVILSMPKNQSLSPIVVDTNLQLLVEFQNEKRAIVTVSTTTPSNETD